MNYQTLMISTNQTFSNVTTILCITLFKLHVIMTQEEKIKDLEHRIELMNDGQSELVKQLEHFRNMASGYKGRNAQFQEEVKKLKEQVKHYKELDLEGDKLYEEKIAELDEAKKEIARLKRMPCADAMLQTKCIGLEEQVEKKNTFIEQLQCNVQDLKMQLDKAESTIESQKAIINELDETLVELNKPWWKKLFR